MFLRSSRNLNWKLTLLRGFVGISTRNSFELLGMWMSKGHSLSDHFFCDN